MVYDLAYRYSAHRPKEEREELIGEGSVGLCMAVESFAASLAASSGARPDCRFSTFASRRISAAIISHKRTDGTILCPESAARAEKEAAQRWNSLAQELEREPSGTEFRAQNRQEVEFNLVQPRYVGLHETGELADNSLDQADQQARAWESLSSSTRALFCSVADLCVETDNVSLSQVAHYLEADRSVLKDHLQAAGEAYNQADATREG